jgi:uncharacterized protein (UPF0332 family)
VKPETRELLDKANECLADAIRFQPLGSRVAAREAYLAAFHGAQALIYERTSRIAKTHRGARAQFSRIARELPDLDPGLTAFSRTDMKSKHEPTMAPGRMLSSRCGRPKKRSKTRPVS